MRVHLQLSSTSRATSPSPSFVGANTSTANGHEAAALLLRSPGAPPKIPRDKTDSTKPAAVEYSVHSAPSRLFHTTPVFV